MKSLRSLVKGNLECTSGYAVFALVSIYVLYNKQPETVGLGAGVALILYVLTGGNVLVSSVLGALVSLVALYYSRTPMVRVEGFQDEEEKEAFEDKEEEGFEEDEKNEEGFEDDDEKKEEGFEDVSKEKKVKKAKAKAKRVAENPAPDNGDRAEFFKLGKKYKLPNEADDEDYHLDAGTTFMNAYKSLKPDQIASMSKDTQELMQTQKQLMGTLATLKPLITDGKQMMEMFQGYFGKGGMGN
jgi:membrane protein implicated in regulation of membrane protease activity